MIEHYKNLSLENIVEQVDGIVYTENWLPIKGFERYYSISNFGRVKSHQRECIKKRKTGTIYKAICKEKILKHKLNNRKYHMIGLSAEDKKKYFTVHRLVGLHFIPNPKNKPQINHKFGNKKDNRMWMLEWNTNSENGLHSFRELGRKQNKIYLGKFGKEHNRSKPVVQFDLDWNFIKEWENAQQVKREIGWSSSHIQSVCLGHRKSKTAYGFKWKYKSEIVQEDTLPHDQMTLDFILKKL